MLLPNGQPLTADLAASQFQSARAKQKRLDEARVSGIRALLYGGITFGGAALLGFVLPPSMWLLAPLLGGIAALLVLFGAMRLIAAALLARRR